MMKPADDNICILVNRLSLDLPILEAGRLNLSSATNVGGKFARTARGAYVAALRDIELTLRTGDRLGVIGHNGAGKTTLLRVLGGIYQPTSGRCIVRGRVSAMFSSSMGLDWSATGIENIRFACALYDIPRSRVNSIIEDIREFSDLGDYLNLPIRTYSDGMRTRLGFSIITSVNPEILIVDEALGAGDINFAHKAQKRILGFLDRVNVLVAASHSIELLRLLCDRAVWMQRGRIEMTGPLDEVWGAYSQAQL
jgi:ABC-2 type transport system ATP-binding protein